MELILVILTAVGHVALELATSGMKGAAESLNRPQHVYNLAAVAAWSIWLIIKFRRTPGLAARVGFRRGGFWPAMRDGGLFALLAAVPLILFGVHASRFPLPGTFWLLFCIYPLWGLAQQFALQTLITRNLRRWIQTPWQRVLAVTLLFSAAHFPNYWLMALTACAGVAFTWIYERHENLWAVGLIHGWLGAAAYYLVLGHDAGRDLLTALHVHAG